MAEAVAGAAARSVCGTLAVLKGETGGVGLGVLVEVSVRCISEWRATDVDGLAPVVGAAGAVPTAGVRRLRLAWGVANADLVAGDFGSCGTPVISRAVGEAAR